MVIKALDAAKAAKGEAMAKAIETLRMTKVFTSIEVARNWVVNALKLSADIANQILLSGDKRSETVIG